MIKVGDQVRATCEETVIVGEVRRVQEFKDKTNVVFNVKGSVGTSFYIADLSLWDVAVLERVEIPPNPEAGIISVDGVLWMKTSETLWENATYEEATWEDLYLESDKIHTYVIGERIKE